jgi:predicted CopG family antitoxin
LGNYHSIKIDEEAYHQLLKVKAEITMTHSKNVSFSDVIKQLIKKWRGELNE